MQQKPKGFGAVCINTISKYAEKEDTYDIYIYTPFFFMLSCKVNHDHAHHLNLWAHEPIA